jgi:hypothetical protein
MGLAHETGKEVIRVKAIPTILLSAVAVGIIIAPGGEPATANPLPVLSPEFEDGGEFVEGEGVVGAQGDNVVAEADPPVQIEAATKTEYEIGTPPDPPVPPPPRTPVGALTWSCIKALFR